MALIEDCPDATEPSDTEYGTLRNLAVNLCHPEKLADHAWVFYQVTGDREKLEDIYDPLALNLNWSRFNMRWVYGENNHFDERDGEFVTSLVFDLK